MSTMRSNVFRPAATPGPGRLIRRLLHAWAGDIAHYFVRRAALSKLRKLNDRELRDIGLTRSQIEAAAYGFMPRADQRRM